MGFHSPSSSSPKESSEEEEEEDPIYEDEGLFMRMERPSSSSSRRRERDPAANLAVTCDNHRLRIEHLEATLQASEEREHSALSLTEVLADRVADMSVFNIQMGVALALARAMVKKLTLALLVFAVVEVFWKLFK